MHDVRDSRLAELGLVLALISLGCANAVRGANDYDSRIVRVYVTNETPETVMVRFARAGADDRRLGPVRTMQRRAFQVSRAQVEDLELQLVAVPLDAPPVGFPYLTLPFRSGGIREVHWVIRGRERYSAVKLR